MSLAWEFAWVAGNAVLPHRSDSIGFHTHRTRESLAFSKHINGNTSCVSYIPSRKTF